MTSLRKLPLGSWIALETRVLVAWSLIAIVALGAVAWLAIYLPRRQRERLRRRGIKRP